MPRVCSPLSANWTRARVMRANSSRTEVPTRHNLVDLRFSGEAREDYQHWLVADRKVLRRLNAVIKDAWRSPLRESASPNRSRETLLDGGLAELRMSTASSIALSGRRGSRSSKSPPVASTIRDAVPVHLRRHTVRIQVGVGNSCIVFQHLNLPPVGFVISRSTVQVCALAPWLQHFMSHPNNLLE